MLFFQHLVGNLTSLLKTVRSVEDKASRGSRAIESSIEAIKHATLVRILMLLFNYALT